MENLPCPGADPTKILTRRELAAVLADLGPRPPFQERPAQSHRFPPGQLLRSPGERDSQPANCRRPDGVVPTTPTDSHRRRQGRQAADCAAWEGWGHIGRLGAWRAERANAEPNDPFVVSCQPARQAKGSRVTRYENVFVRLAIRWD